MIQIVFFYTNCIDFIQIVLYYVIMKVIKEIYGIDEFPDEECIRWRCDDVKLVVRLYKSDNTVALFDGNKILFMRSYSNYSSAYRCANRLVNKYFGGAQ